jgi:hypothetical protein
MERRSRSADRVRPPSSAGVLSTPPSRANLFDLGKLPATPTTTEAAAALHNIRIQHPGSQDVDIFVGDLPDLAYQFIALSTKVAAPVVSGLLVALRPCVVAVLSLATREPSPDGTVSSVRAVLQGLPHRLAGMPALAAYQLLLGLPAGHRHGHHEVYSSASGGKESRSSSGRQFGREAYLARLSSGKVHR